MVDPRDPIRHKLPRAMAGDSILAQFDPLVSGPPAPSRRTSLSAPRLSLQRRNAHPCSSDRFCISRHGRLRRELPAAVKIDSLPLRRRFGWPSQTEEWVRQIEEARKVL